MHTSTYLTRFLTLLICTVFPSYLAFRGFNLLSDISHLLSSLSLRAEVLHVALTSPLAVPAVPISKEAPEASTEPAKLARAPQDTRRKRYPSFQDGLAHSINSFEQYPFLAEQVVQRKYARYAKQTPAQKAMSSKLSYFAHFEKTRKGIEVNARFSEQVAQIAREAYSTGPSALEDEEDAEYGLVDLAFGHLSRDWSSQGAEERKAVFPPVLDALEKHFGEHGKQKKVLVPGSGMGRLASDIADLGTSIHLVSRG
jgi:carnosine N-methyltransferase